MPPSYSTRVYGSTAVCGVCDGTSLSREWTCCFLYARSLTDGFFPPSPPLNLPRDAQYTSRYSCSSSAKGGGRSKGRGGGYDDDDDSDFEFGAASKKKKASKAKPVPASAPPTRAPVPELVLCSSGGKVGRSRHLRLDGAFVVSGGLFPAFRGEGRMARESLYL